MINSTEKTRLAILVRILTSQRTLQYCCSSWTKVGIIASGHMVSLVPNYIVMPWVMYSVTWPAIVMIGLALNTGESLPMPANPANSVNSTGANKSERGPFTTPHHEVLEQNTTTPATKECLVRVIEIVDGEEILGLYNATKEEVEDAGLEIFDEICNDDLLNWHRVIKNTTLCSLVGAEMCLNGKNPEEFKRRVKMLPKKKKLGT